MTQGEGSPLDSFVGMLNESTSAFNRHYDGPEVRIHVSDLIKCEPSRMFCPRHFVMSHADPCRNKVRTITPAQELLFAMGHAVHEQVRRVWIEHSTHAHLAWGVWRCACGKLEVQGTKAKASLRKCVYCRQAPVTYDEATFHVKSWGVMGHPDFLVKWGGYLHLYEVKSISRKDLIFDELDSPLGDHILQASVYYYLGRALGHRIHPKLRYIYVDRDPAKLFRGRVYKEFVRDVAGWDRVKPFILKATECVRDLTEGTLPPRICASSGCSRAKNCDRVVSCFSL